MKSNQFIAVAALIFHGLCAFLVKACVHNYTKTDVCTHGLSPCGIDGYCCCSKKVAVCAKFGYTLTYIPLVVPFRRSIIFQDNYLPFVNPSTFANITQPSKLVRLVLCHNEIRQVAPDAFRQLTTLFNLDLSDNVRMNLTDLSIAFKDCTCLQSLRLQNIGITHLDRELFANLKKTRLSSIDLSRNQLTTLDVSVFAPIENLRNLVLKQCNIKMIEIPARLPVLESLVLQGNRLTYSPPTFCLNNSNDTGFPKLKMIDLRDNLFSDLEGDFLNCAQHITSLRIGGNAITVLRNNTFRKFQKLEDLSIANMAGKLKHIDVLTFHLPQLRWLSAANNSIHFKRGVNAHLLKSLIELESLDLSYNTFSGIDPGVMADMFTSLKKLSKLVLNSAKFSHIHASLINQLPNLRSCLLKGNKIREINGAFNNAKKLIKLTLADNKINIIRPNDFSMSLFETLKVMDLTSNPYTCDCDLMWFRSLIGDSGIVNNKTRLKSWPNGYTCRHANTITLLKDYHPTTEMCTIINPWRLVMITFASTFFMVTLTFAVAYRKRKYLHYWVYKTRKQLFQTSEIFYDVYVVYHDTDSEFVHGELREMLEVRMNIKLHIWHRDASTGPLMNVLVDAIYASRYVIAVVSSDFIEDSLCNFQLEVALDRDSALKRQNVFLIRLEDFQNKNLDSDWCVILARSPSATWCDDKENLQRLVFDQKIEKFLDKHREETHHSRYGTV